MAPAAARRCVGSTWHVTETCTATRRACGARRSGLWSPDPTPVRCRTAGSKQSAVFASIRRAVFVHELPLAADHQRLQVVIRIAALVTGRSVSHFQVNDVLPGFVDEAVAVAGARLEAGA